MTQGIFAASLAFFAIVMVFAGRMMPEIGPRALAVSGGAVLGIGYILAGLAGGTDFWSLFFLIGIVGGSGIGLAYVVPITVGMRRFPDKKGLITGLAVAGFGFGATLESLSAVFLWFFLRKDGCRLDIILMLLHQGELQRLQ